MKILLSTAGRANLYCVLMRRPSHHLPCATVNQLLVLDLKHRPHFTNQFLTNHNLNSLLIGLFGAIS